MSDDELLVETRERIRTVTLNRPHARNALSLALRRRLNELFAQTAVDDDVAVVVLTGSDPAFCGGVDIKELRSGTAREGSGVVTDPASALRAIPKPVIGAINGACITGGLELALGCDVLIASEHARFADTHARIGFVPAWGMTAFLARAIGTRKAIELSLTGELMDAREALRCGLVNQVVPHDDLMLRAHAIAASMRDCTPDSVRILLDLYRRANGVSVDDALSLEREAFMAWRADRGGLVSRLSPEPPTL